MPDLYFGATEEPTETARAQLAEAIPGYDAVPIRDSERLAPAGRPTTRERCPLPLPSLHTPQRASGQRSPGALVPARAAPVEPPSAAPW